MQGCLVLTAGVTDVSDRSSINGVLTKITENDCEQQAVMEVAGSYFIPAARALLAPCGSNWLSQWCRSTAEDNHRIIFS